MNVNDMDKYRIGILCPSQYFNREGDLMWTLSRYFIIISIVLSGIAIVYSWGLSTCFKPTYTNWKILSVVSILAAGAQIPAFLLFASEPCQMNNAQCSSSVGFFMLLWSIVLLAVITLVTQCLDFPKWREDMERWKVKERDFPIYDYEDSYNDVEWQEPRRARNRLVSSHFTKKEKKKQVKMQLEETIDHVNTAKRRRTKKNTLVDFYMLDTGSDVENASQCLSGMCVDMPRDDEGDGEIDIVQVDGETLAPKDCKFYNEEWGEKIRARDLERLASESQVPTSAKQSPGRTKVLKKGRSHVSYFVLKDDYDGDSGESYSDDHSDEQSEDSHYDLELNHDSGYDECGDAKVINNDTQSMVSSSAGDQVQIVDLSTGLKETLVVDGDHDNDDDDNSNAFVTKSFSPPRQKLSPPSPPVVVSDEEDNDNDSLDVLRVADQFELHQEFDELETISIPKLRPIVKNDYMSDGNMTNMTQDELEMLSSDENYPLPFDSFASANKDLNRLQILRDSSKVSRWLDVLDTTVGNDSDHHVIKYQDSDDLDDENDHMEMIMALRGSSLQMDKTLQGAHKISSSHPKIKDKATHLTFEDDESGEGALVSDDENEEGLLGLNARPRSTLCPDEVEV